MPFRSQAQRRWMYANKPEMAKRWEKHTPKGKKLPEKVKKESITDRIDAILDGKERLRSTPTNIAFENKLEQALRAIS